MSYVAFTTVVHVENFIRKYQASTVTQMTAICKIKGRKNKAIGRGGVFRKAVHFDVCTNTALIDNNEFSFLLID